MVRCRKRSGALARVKPWKERGGEWKSRQRRAGFHQSRVFGISSKWRRGGFTMSSSKRRSVSILNL